MRQIFDLIDGPYTQGLVTYSPMTYGENLVICLLLFLFFASLFILSVGIAVLGEKIWERWNCRKPNRYGVRG